MSEQFVSVPAEYISNVFGSYDENIKALEKALGVLVLNRGDDIKITGEKFDFTTDFESFVKSENKDAESEDDSVKEDVITLRKTEVNFDDADEFDFRVDVND